MHLARRLLKQPPGACAHQPVMPRRRRNSRSNTWEKGPWPRSWHSPASSTCRWNSNGIASGDGGMVHWHTVVRAARQRATSAPPPARAEAEHGCGETCSAPAPPTQSKQPLPNNTLRCGSSHQAQVPPLDIQLAPAPGTGTGFGTGTVTRGRLRRLRSRRQAASAAWGWSPRQAAAACRCMQQRTQARAARPPPHLPALVGPACARSCRAATHRCVCHLPCCRAPLRLPEVGGELVAQVRHAQRVLKAVVAGPREDHVGQAQLRVGSFGCGGGCVGLRSKKEGRACTRSTSAAWLHLIATSAAIARRPQRCKAAPASGAAAAGTGACRR